MKITITNNDGSVIELEGIAYWLKIAGKVDEAEDGPVSKYRFSTITEYTGYEKPFESMPSLPDTTGRSVQLFHYGNVPPEDEPVSTESFYRPEKRPWLGGGGPMSGVGVSNVQRCCDKEAKEL